MDPGKLGKFHTWQSPSLRLPFGVGGALVGKCVVLSDAGRMYFPISNHWSRTASEEMGGASLISWEFGNQSALAAAPPALGDLASSSLSRLVGHIPDGVPPFQIDLWASISALVGDYILEVGAGFWQIAHTFPYGGQSVSPQP